MTRKNCLCLALLLASMNSMAQQTLNVSVKNNATTNRDAVPVVIDLKTQTTPVKSALVTLNGVETACQLDDLDGDGTYDELCFITSLKKKEEKTFVVSLSKEGAPKEYPAKVYAEMLISNKKVKSSNKHDLYISSLTVDNGTNPYWMLHHHGPAFENEMVAYRIYFDHRQTVDIYGKYKQGLELKHTQFYPDKEQKAQGYGDDVLWVGQTFGLGTLRGWDGNAPQMLTDVEHRTLKLVARGPLRTIVEVIDDGWKAPCPTTKERISMNTRYTLYAGKRDCEVSISFNKPVPSHNFSTGIINVKNSVEHSNGKGLRGCWGTDWPVSEKDSAGHKRETVGLGIYIPQKNVVKELTANKDNYPFVVGNINRQFTYHITFCSDNETWGFHSAKEWFAYLDGWKKELESPVTVSIK